MAKKIEKSIHSQMYQNIKSNYIYLFLSNLNLTRGLWMIYLVSKGQSLLAVGLLESIFHLTSFLMEVPTGAISDIYGRKISRLLGRFVFILSTLILIFAENFTFFAIAFIFSALSYNLESGSGEALIYDSLKVVDQETKYMKIFGKVEVSFQLSTTIALIIGGYLGNINYLYAFSATVIISTIALIYGSLSFTEAVIYEKEMIQLNFIKSIKNQINNSIKAFEKNRRIAYLILFSMLMSSVATSFFFYLQNYFKFKGYSEFKIGIILSLAGLVGAFGASRTDVIESKIKEQGILKYMPILMSVSLFGIAFTTYEFIFYIFLSLGECILYVAVNDYINKLIDSDVRSTILSFMSMAFSFYMIIIFPIIGFIGDQFSLKISFIVISFIFACITVVNFINLHFIKND